jgi:hypothetical protein
MPRDDQHRTKAERNEKFAESLDSKDAVQESWAVVAAFYSALHYAEQFFIVVDGYACGDHPERNERFKADIRIRMAYDSYKYLYSLSRTARYRVDPLPASAYEKLAKPHLAAVKRQIDFALKKAKDQSA